jgi:hypothetical protein
MSIYFQTAHLLFSAVAVATSATRQLLSGIDDEVSQLEPLALADEDGPSITTCDVPATASVPGGSSSLDLGLQQSKVDSGKESRNASVSRYVAGDSEYGHRLGLIPQRDSRMPETLFSRGSDTGIRETKYVLGDCTLSLCRYRTVLPKLLHLQPLTDGVCVLV